MYVCLCRAVTDGALVQLGHAGVREAQAIIQTLRLDEDDCCGFCRDNIQDLVTIAGGKADADRDDPPPPPHRA